MKNKKIITTLVLSIFYFLISACSALVIQVPNAQWQSDIIVNWTTKIQADESSIFEYIQIINKYLRFAIWVVAMAVLIIWAFQLMSSQWDWDKLKKAHKLMKNLLVNDVISISKKDELQNLLIEQVKETLIYSDSTYSEIREDVLKPIISKTISIYQNMFIIYF
jgi:hypothetical protein